MEKVTRKAKKKSVIKRLYEMRRKTVFGRGLFDPNTLVERIELLILEKKG